VFASAQQKQTKKAVATIFKYFISMVDASPSSKTFGHAKSNIPTPNNQF